MSFKIQYLPIGQIKLNSSNPRIIKDAAFKRLVKSLQDCPSLFDARPLLCSDRTGKLIVLGGNMRLRAAQELKYDKVPVIILPDLTELQEREVAIKDNGLFGEWDFEALANEWSELPLAEWGVPLPEDWLNTEEPKDAEPQIDRAEELNKKWQVKTGDLFMVGSHRLLYGDSTKAEDVARVMGGEKAVLCVSDPPYNYDYQYASIDDNLDEEAFIKFTNTWFFIARQFASVRVITPGLKNLSMFLKNYGATWICAWIKKNAMTASKIGNLSVWEPIVFDADDCDWEPVIVYGKPRKKVKRDVYEYPVKVQKDTANHPCPKLLEFWAKLIKDFSKPIDCVLDVFLGSGTTMVACQNLNRKCRGVEISPAYCAVILERMATAFPGIEIRRIS